MAYRRTRVRAYRAPRKNKLKARRRFRKRRYRSSRRLKGNFTLIVRRSYTITVDESKGSLHVIAPKINDFTEVEPFWQAFESYRIWNIRVTIRPHFNVAIPGDHVPPYYATPWHSNTPVNVSTDTIISTDRCKTYHGCSSSSRNYVPAVLVYTKGTGGQNFNIDKLAYRPKLNLGAASRFDSHLAALYWFPPGQGSTPSTTLRQYEMTLSGKITLYNQNKLSS